MKKTLGKFRSSPITDRKKNAVVEVSGFLLVRDPRAQTEPAVLKPHEKTGALLRRIGLALDKPGIAERPTKPGVYSYSAHPADPAKVIQRDWNGASRLGRLVRGRFYPERSAYK